MREIKVLIKGVETNLRIEGEGKPPTTFGTKVVGGKPLLILHGWGIGSSLNWVKIQKILAIQGYKAILPDFPGFGKSADPPKAWCVSDYAEWLKSLTDFLKIKKFSILAHSFGGRVALKFISENPKRVEKLILCAPAGIKSKLGLEAKIVFRLAKLGNIIFKIKQAEKIKNGFRKVFYIFLRHKDYTKTKGIMRETIKRVISEDLTHCLSKIDVETLIIWGKKDKIVPLKYADIFNKKIKNSKLVVIPKVGHSLQLENPEKLLEVIIPFLR